ncbi:hypothetical protein [Bradyrhizobium quebecense]|uniref:Uncharacterized protein n=2 Tax=Bradyrhizobium quebecense TaxID=2748629 RepID=A0ABS3M8Y3_9BRAD|nr:hypothetical protein [Bradyrhizobium quebecense]UGY03281.1 hypothetical protein J4P68_0000415 [Bradyrhizobium quebecense]
MAKTTTNTNIDADILALIERHDLLFARLDALYKMEQDDVTEPERAAIMHEAEELAIQIIATPVHTRRALNGKERVAVNEGFDGDDMARRVYVHDLERIAARRRRTVTATDHAAAPA